MTKAGWVSVGATTAGAPFHAVLGSGPQDAILVNLRSLGALIVSADQRPERAEAITTGFPDPEACDRFGADVATVARFHDATAPIATARGLRWSWALEDPGEARTRFVVVRDDTDNVEQAGERG